jgi:hypothetical protein
MTSFPLHCAATAIYYHRILAQNGKPMQEFCPVIQLGSEWGSALEATAIVFGGGLFLGLG